MAFAKVMIIGNLGRDPEMRYTPNGRPVTEFSVAVSHRSRDDATGEWKDDQTGRYRVTVWGERAERTAEQFRKGNKVFVEGRFRTREFEGKDGQKRTSLEITADSIVNLERRGRDEEGSFAPAGAEASFNGGGSSRTATAPPRSGGGGGDDTDLDDLP